jgi:hypothetical protein
VGQTNAIVGQTNTIVGQTNTIVGQTNAKQKAAKISDEVAIFGILATPANGLSLPFITGE